MTWRELPPLATDVADQLPELPEVALVAGHIADFTAELWAEERPALARAALKRVHEFSTGRHLARCAMAELGAAPAPIPKREDRSPAWPEGVLGSITHADAVAVAAAARPDAVAAVGVDLERVDRMAERLHRKVLTPAERRRLADADARLPGLVFSAKEAGYKAVNPRVGRFIGFQEAEVDVTWSERRFRLRYVGEHPANRIMDTGVGYFCFFEHYVLTVFMIPR